MSTTKKLLLILQYERARQLMLACRLMQQVASSQEE